MAKKHILLRLTSPPFTMTRTFLKTRVRMRPCAVASFGVRTDPDGPGS
jgi:hypothetical protein